MCPNEPVYPIFFASSNSQRIFVPPSLMRRARAAWKRVGDVVFGSVGARSGGGYLNQVRSSRRLEREAGRNLELIWLLQGLAPGFRTIGDFRKDNRDALQAANRDFVLLARGLDLLGGELVAIDGAFFHGDASKASIVTA